MKTSNQINNLPIISISNGEQIGKVKTLVVNPEKGSVDFLMIEHEDFQVNVKAIPFKKVIGIGEFAVTVDSESAIIDLNEIPIANQLVNKKINIVSTKVMTRKGELLGEISEYYIDQDTGHILGLQVTLPEREVVLPSDSVITFGKEIVVVKEDVASFFLNTPEELEEKKESTSSSEIDELFPESYDEEDIEEILALKEKQIELLTGKKLKKSILGKNGEVLFHEGDILTSEQIQQAQKEGPSIIVEISMNVEA